MNTVQLLEHVLEMDRQGRSVLDEQMVSAISDLPAHIPLILDALNKASDACASLDNVMLHLGECMSVADRMSRNLVALDLAHALDILTTAS